MKLLLAVILIFSLFVSLQSEKQLMLQDASADKDISINPALDYLSVFENPSYREDTKGHIVSKINFDFNYDGIIDIALTDLHLWGAHIGPWKIYLGIENDKFLFIDEVWFHNDAVRFDSVSKGISKIIVFDKAGGEVVDIVEYTLSRHGIKETSRKTLRVKNAQMVEAFDEYNFQNLADSCIVVTEYLKDKKLQWKRCD